MDYPTPEILQIRSEDTHSASVLHMRGELDMVSAPSLRESLMRLIIEGRGLPIIVDCAELQYLDMKGVRVLEDCHREADHRGLRLILIGSNPLVHRILTIIELDHRIPLVETMADAVNALGWEE